MPPPNKKWHEELRGLPLSARRPAKATESFGVLPLFAFQLGVVLFQEFANLVGVIEQALPLLDV